MRIIASFISEWLKEIVVLFIIISLVDLIMPKGKLRRYVDFIMGILIIFTVISPFTRLNNISLDLDKEVSNFNSKVVSQETILRDQRDQIEQLYKNNLTKKVKKITEENTNYKVKEVNIITLPDKENIFMVEKLIIILSDNIMKQNTSTIRIKKVKVASEEYIPVDNQEQFADLSQIVSSYLQIDKEKLVISLDKEDKDE